MAKQRGIHQISGTVNNLTYYEQKYVKGGLIRRVNEGMSGRLKTDPAFENTRSKNAIFGMCSKIASAVWSRVPSGTIGAIRPSMHARTTRFLYQYFMQQGFTLGDIPELDSDFTRRFIDFLNSQVRNKISDFDPSIKTYEENIDSSGSFIFPLNSVVMDTILKKLNTNAVAIGGRWDVAIQAPFFDSIQKKYLPPIVFEEVRQPLYFYRLGGGDDEVSFPVSRAALGFKFWCIQVFPTKAIRNTYEIIYDRSITLFVGYVN